MESRDSARDLPSGTVAFLFSDVEGSTELLRRLREAYGGVLAEQGRLLREAFEAHGGRVVDSQGDSLFAVFPRVRDAAAAAAQAQREVAAHPWPADSELRVRMGLHVGEPERAGERYVGLGVHRAARISALAHGGQVLLSQAAASLLADNEPPDASLRDVGEHGLKDFEQPERLFQLTIRGLRSEFPSLTAAVPTEEMRHRLDFRVLGPLEVLDHEGRPLAVGGRRERALLAVLALERGRVLSTDVLVDRLWGEKPPKTATTSLHNAISRLRKVLGAERLVTRPPGYALRVERDELDLDRFERLVAEARELKPEARAGILRNALALWRGPPLAEFAYEAFAQNEIGRLEELRLSALEDRVDADLELGRHGELVGELETLVVENPLRERLRGQLMLALYRSGRQAEALQAYQETRRALVEELGIDPSPQLQELERAILRQESGLQPSAAPARLADHFGELTGALLAGRLVPVLGRLATAADGGRYPPVAADIASHLAECFDCPPDEGAELARISQYVAVTRGPGPLHDELHTLFDDDFEAGPLPRLFARLPAKLRERGAPQLLLVTTNYDLAFERALLDEGEEFDVVSYVAAGPHRGKFLHLQPDGLTTVIDVANTYTALDPDRRTVVLKVHGGVDRRPEREWESFVVSEDDYIDFLARADIANLVPVTLAARLRRSHALFLGYPPQDWSLRVFLRRVWGGERVSYRSWAVAARPSPLERDFWRHVDVDLLDVRLDEYVAELAERLDRITAPEAAA